LVCSKLFGYFTIVLGSAAMIFGLYAMAQDIVTGLFIVLQGLAAFVTALFFIRLGLGLSVLLDVHAEALEELIDEDPEGDAED